MGGERPRRICGTPDRQAADFVAAMPGGRGVPIDQGGTHVSAAERQRLAIAALGETTRLYRSMTASPRRTPPPTLLRSSPQARDARRGGGHRRAAGEHDHDADQIIVDDGRGGRPGPSTREPLASRVLPGDRHVELVRMLRHDGGGGGTARGADGEGGWRSRPGGPRTCAGRCGRCPIGCAHLARLVAAPSSASPRTGSWCGGRTGKRRTPSTASLASSCCWDEPESASDRPAAACRVKLASMRCMYCHPGVGVDLTLVGQVLAGRRWRTCSAKLALNFGQGYIMAGVTQRAMYGCAARSRKWPAAVAHCSTATYMRNILSRSPTTSRSIHHLIEQGLSQRPTSAPTIAGCWGMMFWICCCWPARGCCRGW